MATKPSITSGWSAPPCSVDYMADIRIADLNCGDERQRTVRGMTDLERFNAIGWDVTETGCWHWRGSFWGKRAKFGNGRGNRNAARVLWELIYGEVTDGLEVCHECNNPACINPEHLKLGTHAENMDDFQKVRKPKLDPVERRRVQELYRTGIITMEELSRAFLVSEALIRLTLTGGLKTGRENRG